MTATRNLDELLHHWPTVVRKAKAAWPRDFALSIQRQAKCTGWTPSDKQLVLMRSAVSELFQNDGAGADDIDVVERDE